MVLTAAVTQALRQGATAALAAFAGASGWLPVEARAAGAESALRGRTPSYDVRLGVVPVRDIRAQPKRVEQHKTLHGGLMREPGTQHVTVAVYAAGTERRVPDATVIAEVRYRKWRGGKRVEKPLERMLSDGTITYGNFFPIPEPGDYEITARVYTTNADGPEVARFGYRRTP